VAQVFEKQSQVYLDDDTPVNGLEKLQNGLTSERKERLTNG